MTVDGDRQNLPQSKLVVLLENIPRPFSAFFLFSSTPPPPPPQLFVVCLNILLCRLRSAGIPILSPDHQIIILISRIERFKSFQPKSLLHCGNSGSPFKVIKLSSTALSLAMPKKREMERSRGVRGPLTLSRFHCRLTLSHAPHPLPTSQPLPLTPLLTLSRINRCLSRHEQKCRSKCCGCRERQCGAPMKG